MMTTAIQKSIPLSPEEKAARFLRYLEAGNPFMAGEYKLNIYHSLSVLPWERMVEVMSRFTKRIEWVEKELPQRIAAAKEIHKRLQRRLEKRKAGELIG